jgi:hypothetical protein
LTERPEWTPTPLKEAGRASVCWQMEDNPKLLLGELYSVRTSSPRVSVS